MRIMNEHFESRATLAGSPDEVFAYVDDPAHLSGHMAKRSWAMAGGRMELGLDEGGGRQVGSHIYARWCTERMVSDAVRHFSTHKERE